ncbi:Fic family protein [Hymenobacter psoromatis]|uniref:Fic family protein n=1 Tax=Hymenobacter psoromatis TaxID=1484116 RepID=UPI001CBCAFF3|nr:Fic family protein [Hymenobacter psoromatis]
MNSPEPPLDFTNPADGLLYNIVGATSQTHLDHLEKQLSIGRFTEYRFPKSNAPAPDVPAPSTPAVFNEQYARHIHSYLFQDVYPWAGETRADRNFQGQKKGDREGYLMSYAHYRQISPDLAAVSAQLSQENNLKGLDKDQFVKRAAYYMDHYNHIHAFREGNGRTVQAMFFDLGKQAGYKLDLTPEYREFNPARDTALIAESTNLRNNMGRLEGLLARLVQPRAGKEAELARHPSQARPLAEPTLAVVRIEALRELKAASQAVNIRLNELRRTKEGDPLHNALFMNLQRHVTPKPEALAQLAPALHRQVEDAAQAPAKVGNGQAQLDRFSRAIDQAALLYAGQSQQLIVIPPAPAGESRRKTVPTTEVQQIEAPKATRRRPKR